MRKLGIVVGLGILALSTSIAAADLKIATVNVAQVLQNSSQVSADRKIIDDKFHSRFTQIQSAQKDLDNKAADLQKNELTMQSKDIQQAKQQLMSEQQKIEAMQQSFQHDLTAEKQKEMQALADHLQETVKKVASQGNYNLVLAKATVLYTDSAIPDITDQVAKAFDGK